MEVTKTGMLDQALAFLYSLIDRTIRWRPLEAAFAAVGSQAEPVLDCVQDEQDSGREKPIDIESLLMTVIPSILSLPREWLESGSRILVIVDAVVEQPFLQGRGFVFASQFSSLLPLQSSGQYLEAALHVIESNEAGVPVKISAIKAVHKFVASILFLSALSEGKVASSRVVMMLRLRLLPLESRRISDRSCPLHQRTRLASSLRRYRLSLRLIREAGLHPTLLLH